MALINRVELVLEDGTNLLPVIFCSAALTSEDHYRTAASLLHPRERPYYEGLVSPRRMQSYLAGRFAAKHAVAGLVGEPSVATIAIENGVLHQPVVTRSPQPDVQVSLSHCEHLAVAVASRGGVPVGIDLERVSTDRVGVLERQMTERELALMQPLSFSYAEGLTLLWTAKEALSKNLRTGLTTSFQLLEAGEVESRSDGVIQYRFVHFPQYQSISWTAGAFAISLVYPRVTCVTWDLERITGCFSPCVECGSASDL